MKRIVVLGSTGSIGCNILDVVAHQQSEFKIVGLAAHRRVEHLADQCAEHPEAIFVVTDNEANDRLLASHAGLKSRAAGTGNPGARVVSSADSG